MSDSVESEEFKYDAVLSNRFMFVVALIWLHLVFLSLCRVPVLLLSQGLYPMALVAEAKGSPDPMSPILTFFPIPYNNQSHPVLPFTVTNLDGSLGFPNFLSDTLLI
jgi:hypothetical protein